MSWGYKKEDGPHRWGTLFPIAVEGSRQSPIDIDTSEVKVDVELKPIKTKYTPENTKDIENTGASFKVNVDGEGSELTGGPLEGKYELWQFHAHWGANDSKGSEHTVDGKEYAAELHLVHWNTKYGSPGEAVSQPDGLAVLGMFLQAGETPHPEFAKLNALLPSIKKKGAKIDISDKLNPGNFLPKSLDFWTYEGSLTTPPLAECVRWIVFKEPLTLSKEQLRNFRRMKIIDEDVDSDDEETNMVDNFRPPVPRGERLVRTNAG